MLAVAVARFSSVDNAVSKVLAVLQMTSWPGIGDWDMRLIGGKHVGESVILDCLVCTADLQCLLITKQTSNAFAIHY